MKPYEQTELLKVVLALAAVDGKIARSERGVFESLADRIGVGRVSLDAMIEKARREPAAKDELFQLTTSDPAHAFKLLVATARIDGEIADAERELLVVIASVLGITGDRFATLYREAIDQADQLRRNR